MSLVAWQRRALADMRRLLESFVQEEISVAEFLPQFRKLFAPFDPPDLANRDLTDAEKSDLEVFIQIMGGWFREDDDLIPKCSEWEYGKNTEPYSWIDGPAYRRWIMERLARAGI